MQWFRQIALLLFLAGCTASPEETPDASPPETSSALFTDVTQQAGLGSFQHFNGSFGEAWAPEIVGGGGGFLDYDNDGWLDILLVAGGNFRGRTDKDIQTLYLYRNNQDGTFSETSASAGLADVKTYGLGLAMADYDNDGDTDIFLSTLYENLLFNNEKGTFTEIGASAGLSDRAEWSTSALFFDANRDGWLDLYVANYVDWSPEKDLYCAFEGKKVYCTPEEYDGIPGRYYQSNGDGTFTDRTKEAGFLDGIEPIRDKALGVAELDFNFDRWPDLVVANDTERDLLYENNGDGTFTERGVASGVAFSQHGKPRAGMGIDVGVVDSTGQPSIFVGNFSDETVGVYRQIKPGLFQDRAAVSRIGHRSLRTLTFGLILFDADLDTDLDLLTANGHVQTHIERIVEGVTFREPTQLYLNRGDGVFDEAEQEGVLAHKLVARGTAYADYDRDGDLDVLLVENNGPVHLWQNNQNNNNWLRIRVEGSEGNRDGIGTRIEVALGPYRMQRQIRTGSTYLSQSELTATFGLGQATQVDTLWVHWPSGRIDQFEAVLGNREHRIIEGTETFESE